MQRSESSNVDKTVVSSTETSVALKHEDSEAPTLTHKPHDEVSELQTQVLQIISRKFDVSVLHLFPFNQALWRINFYSCMWATVHLSKDEGDFSRIIQKMEVHEIQTVFEAVQAQICNLELCDLEIFGLSEQVDWTDGHWRKNEVLINSNQKYAYSVIHFCGLVENVMENNRISYFVESPEHRIHQEDAWKKQGRIIFMSMYNDVTWWKNPSQSPCRDNAKRVAELAENFKPGRWSFFGLGD